VFVDALRRHLELARRGLLSSRRFPTWLDDVRREARMLELFEAAERGLPNDRTGLNDFCPRSTIGARRSREGLWSVSSPS
jgi:hypothetical protein